MHDATPTKTSKEALLRLIREGGLLTRGQQCRLVALLSLPAIITQLSSILMQYIDATMVGTMGASASASVGLVASTIWLFNAFVSAIATGFAVQVAHRIGASDEFGAREVVRQGLVSALLMSLVLMAVGLAVCQPLPSWLGGGSDIRSDATRYFGIYALLLPVMVLNSLAAGMLRCSGNVIVPSVLGVVMCLSDIVFNFLFIFPSRCVHAFGQAWHLWGAGLGVTGAALGTALAVLLSCVLMLGYMLVVSPTLRLRREGGHFRPTSAILSEAWRIGAPVGAGQSLLCCAQIAGTVIVAPLGTIAIAANTFGITAESLCYMPGFGIADAATTLVGQSLGARRRYLCRSFAYMTVGLGMAVMGLMGVCLYFGAPYLMEMLTPVAEVRALGTQVLRIEAWAEPMYAASIVAYGVFVGAGDTLRPCYMNVLSIWLVRITLAALLAPHYGLPGVWVAMALELTCRGLIFLVRLRWGNWLKLPPKANGAL